jgi:hypothetical protein
MLFESESSFKILETKLVPAYMSARKFNMILFMIFADALNGQDLYEDDSLSTTDSCHNEKLIYQPSDFLREQAKALSISSLFIQELSENIAEAFETCDINNYDDFN